MIDERIVEKMRDSFAKQLFMGMLGAQLTKIKQGAVEIEAPILREQSQQQGYGHAGVTFSLGYEAAGYAALSVLPLDKIVVSVELKINLLRPAVGEKLLARGKVVKAGKQLVIATSEVFAVKDGVEKQVALLQGTAIIR